MNYYLLFLTPILPLLMRPHILKQKPEIRRNIRQGFLEVLPQLASAFHSENQIALQLQNSLEIDAFFVSQPQAMDFSQLSPSSLWWLCRMGASGALPPPLLSVSEIQQKGELPLSSLEVYSLEYSSSGSHKLPWFFVDFPDVCDFFLSVEFFFSNSS